MEITTIIELFLYLSGILFFWKQAPNIVLIFLIFKLFVSTCSYLMAIYGMNNMLSFHADAFVSFYLLSLLIYRNTSFISKKTFLIMVFSFTTLSLISVLFIEKISNFNQISGTISAIWVLGLGLYYFFQILMNYEVYSKTPFFWYITGVFFYSTTNILLFSSFNIIDEFDFFDYISIWSINSIGVIVFQISILGGLYLTKKSKRI